MIPSAVGKTSNRYQIDRKMMSDKIQVSASYDGGFERITVDAIKEVDSGIRLLDEDGSTIGFVTYENLAYAKPLSE